MARKNFKTKRILNKVGKIALIVLAMALGLGCVSMFVAGTREVNPDNLIKVDDNYLPERNPGYGVSFDVDDDGVIKINGNKTSGHVEAIIQTIELEAGTYTLSGIAKPDQGIMTLTARWGAGEFCYAGLYKENGTFTLTEKTTVTIVLNIMADVDIPYANKTIKPVLVADDEPGDFYVKTELFKNNDKADDEK